MDKSEKIASAYLATLGFNDIRYEPDGNVPPDFVLDGTIAVEVRRLNQNFVGKKDTNPQGLEEVAIPLAAKFQSYLKELGTNELGDNSWFVSYDFKRPMDDWKVLRTKLDAVLRPFMHSLDPQPFERKITRNFSIDVSKASKRHPTFYLLGGFLDYQAGGFLISELATNLQFCIEEKSKKIERAKGDYREWWFVLPDYIGFRFSDLDHSTLKTRIAAQPGKFNRIVLVDPTNPTNAFIAFP